MNDGLHHLYKRKSRVRGGLSSTSKKAFDYLMYAVGIVAPVVLLPQIFQIFLSKNVAGLSLLTWILLGLVNGLWGLYGLIHREPPIYVANLLMAFFDFVIVIGILIFR